MEKHRLEVFRTLRVWDDDQMATCTMKYVVDLPFQPYVGLRLGQSLSPVVPVVSDDFYWDRQTNSWGCVMKDDLCRGALGGSVPRQLQALKASYEDCGWWEEER